MGRPIRGLRAAAAALGLVAMLDATTRAADGTDFDAYRVLVRERAAAPSVIRYNSRAGRYELLTFADLAGYFAATGTPEARDGGAENPWFKVIFGTASGDGSSVPVATVDDLEARNVFYHLNWARRWFEALDPASLGLEGRSIVRLSVDRAYDPVAQFSLLACRGGPDSACFNSQHSIRPDYRGRWGHELWFRPSHQSFDWKKFLLQLAPLAATRLSPLSLATLPLALDRAVRDSHDRGTNGALIPSNIYHEAFHKFTQHGELLPSSFRSHPLSEDLANYFAIAIDGKPAINDLESFSDEHRVRSFARIPKVRPPRNRYDYNFEEFVPALLWRIRGFLPEDRERSARLRELLGNEGSLDGRMLWNTGDAVVWDAIRRLPRSPATPNNPFPAPLASYHDFGVAYLEALEATTSLSAEQKSRVRGLWARYAREFAKLDDFFTYTPGTLSP